MPDSENNLPASLAEEKLREATYQLQQTLDTAAIGLVRLNREMVYISANQVYADLAGLKVEEIVGHRFSEVIGEKAMGVVRPYVERVLRGERVEYETELPWSHSGPKTIHVVYTPWREPDGSISGWVGSIQDVTERAKAEQKLREGDQQFNLIANSIPQLAWMADGQGWIFWYNQRWYDYTGTTFEEMQGWGWEKVHNPKELPRVVESWKRAHQTGEPWEDTFPLRRHDGEFRWHLSRAQPLKDANGKVIYWFGSNTDITEQRRAQEELRRAKEEADAANRAKDRFMAILSHELRTPLAPVLMTVAAMESDETLSPQVKEDLAMIRRNVALETRLIDDLLDLSRILHGKFTTHMSPVNLHSIIEHSIKTCEPEIEDKRIELKRELHASNDTVMGDPARLQQVCWNLLKNAVKFTPPGRKIAFCTENINGHLQVRITDTGIGIPPEALSRIFNAFEQADISTTRHYGGLGLGLAVCKAVIEAHGGTIVAESRGENQGATFTVTLKTVAPEAKASPSSHAAERTGGSLRILVVEDHADTAATLARLLRRDGHYVNVAHNVAEGLAMTQKEFFDLVISDLGLPDGTGYDLMSKLRDRHYPAKGIAMSGYGMDEDLRRSRDVGFLDHLVKPISLTDLEHVIQRVSSKS